MLPGLQPHWEDIETGQDPWPHLKKLLDDQLSCPGERRKSLSSCQNWAHATYELCDLSQVT